MQKERATDGGEHPDGRDPDRFWASGQAWDHAAEIRDGDDLLRRGFPVQTDTRVSALGDKQRGHRWKEKRLIM